MNSLSFESIFDKDKGNVGDLFQTFVYELLRRLDYPKLHKFQTAGNDGGIDLIQLLNNERTVVECKYVGNKDIKEAIKRWKEVKKHFEEHLPNPIPKRKLVKPWLNSDTPITSYLFCVSSEISNQNGFDEFEKEITDFFKSLATRHSHLKHLENIQVEIIDRSKLLQKLDNLPQLKFKWFPLTEKYGFIPIQNKSKTESFRSFLEEDSLPFYNRSKYLEKHPNADIQSEEQLLEILENQNGLIITGSGGAGKTRLTLELGRLSYKKGWLVFRCNETVNVENLNNLIKITPDNSKVLLLMDYVETQKHFTEIIENLQIINDYYNFRIKYVANCRTSFYPTIRLTPGHFHVSLTSSPASQSSNAVWLEQYQASVVRHILENGGIETEDKHLAVCKNSPILAVFLLYLHRKNRDEELENLLQEEDFGKWIQKRTKMSFVNVADFEMKLAKLAAILPFSEDVWNQLDDFNVKLLGILANDGWIEKFQGSEWRSIHDVFADQIILSYVRDNPHFIERFVRDIFSFSYSTNCLESTVVSVQRLSPYLEVDFNKILNAEIDKELLRWKKIRNYLLETSLLQETQKLDLLSNEILWEDAETEVAFQTGFGTIIRRIVNTSDSLTETQLSNAKSWLNKSLPFISSNNFLLVWGLRFSPENIKDLALERMRLYSTDFHTYRVFLAWLYNRLPTSDIRKYVWLWLDRHKRDSEASFIYKSWLDAGEEIDLVKEPIKLWLAQHQTALEAEFVYKSWLDAGGEIDLVREPIKLWLTQHQTILEAKFVYKSWLDAKGEVDLVKEPIKLWLAQHQINFDTGFIYNSWLDAGEEIDLVREPIKLWLAQHQTALEAKFVFKSWLDAKGEIDLVREPIKLWLAQHQTAFVADFVMRAWLDAGGEIDLVKEPIKLWLAQHQTALEADFIMRAWLDAGGEIDLVKEPLKKWLAQHQTAVTAGFMYKSWLNAKGEIDLVREPIKLWLAQHQTAFVADFVMRAWLNAKGDFAYIKEFAVNWLAEHFDKQETIYFIRKLAKQENLPIETVRYILFLCAQSYEDENAVGRLSALKDKLDNSQISEDFIVASERVIKSVLLKDRLKYTIQGQVMGTFFSLFLNAGLQDSKSIDRIEHVYLKWLKHPNSFGKGFTTFVFFQRTIYLERFAVLLEKNSLSIVDDRVSIERFLRHFNNWLPENKQLLQPIIQDLRNKYPSDLWEIVTYQ